MMTAVSAVVAGIIASSLTGPVIAASAENMFGLYAEVPFREEASGSSYPVSLEGMVWNDPSEKPSGFTGSSMYLGGTTKALAGLAGISASDKGLIFGAEDFTIEFWVKSDGIPATGDTTIMGNWYSSTIYRRWSVNFNSTTRLISFEFRTSASTTLTASFSVGANATVWNNFWTAGWHNIVVQRSGTALTIYVDGVAGNVVATIPSGVGNNTNTTLGFLFGAGAYSYNRIFTGWIDEFRVTKNVVRYPTAPFGSSTMLPRGDADPNWSDVTCLLGFDNTFGINLGGTSGYSKSDVVYSSKFESNNLVGLHFDGLASRNYQNWTIGTNSSMNLGSDDFTFEIEFSKVMNATQPMMAPASGVMPFRISAVNNTTQSFKVCDASGADLFTHNLVFVIGNTYKVAIVREGGAIRLYLDGVITASGSISGSVADFGSDILINAAISSDPHHVKGFRFTRGARYKGSTYTPPSATAFLS